MSELVTLLFRKRPVKYDAILMRIIDTHCHPQFAQFDADRDEVIRRALDSGIGMVCVGTDLETSFQAVQLAERYEGLYASVGLHPNDNLHEPTTSSAS
jgi:TatD DNase family protein